MAEGSWIRIGATKVHLDAKTVNAIIQQELGKRAVSITQRPDLRLAIGEEYLKAVTPFVPMKTGQLRESGRATTDGRVYWSAIRPAWSDEGYDFNYAEAMYDTMGIKWPGGVYAKPTTPNTYPRWVEHVQPGTPAYDAFVNNIVPLIREAFARNV